MNKYQRLVLAVAAINIVVLALFPPFFDLPLAKNTLPSFDAFYPLFAKLGIQPMFRDLLTLAYLLIMVNALVAWLVLEILRRKHSRHFDHGKGIAIFAAINVAVMLLFPPFEQHINLIRAAAPSFDSFYFIFSMRSTLPIFAPLLYLEIIFVLINALVIYLLFNWARAGDDAQHDRRDD